MKDEIKFEDFSKIDIRMGKIMAAEVPEGSEKLMKLRVDFGKELGERVIFSGIKEWYKPEDLVGVTTTFVVNLPFRKMGKMGVSEGMLFAASSGEEHGGKPVLLLTQELLKPGTQLV